jgi:hypothetical protein
MIRIARASLIGAIALGTAALAPAQGAAQDLPPAQEIIDRYVEAIGGREAATAAVSTRSTGSFNMPAMGMTGDMEVINSAEGAMSMRVTIPGMGDMLSGYTGEVGWSMDPMTGPRLLEGAELDAMREQAEPLYAVRDGSLFESYETTGENSYDGEACWEVHYVWNSGREVTECYSKESGLVIAQTTSQETPMGVIEVVSRLTRYEQFGQVLVPTMVTQSMMGQEQVMEINDVQIGDIDPSLLEPPAAIQTLIQAGG